MRICTGLLIAIVILLFSSSTIVAQVDAVEDPLEEELFALVQKIQLAHYKGRMKDVVDTCNIYFSKTATRPIDVFYFEVAKNMGLALYALQRNKEAVTYLDKYLAWCDTTKDPLWYDKTWDMHARSTRAYATFNIGNYKASVVDFEACIPYYSDTTTWHESALGYYASALYNLEKYHSAANAYQQLLPKLKKRFGQSHLYYTDNLRYWGLCLSLAGMHQKADSVFSVLKHIFLNPRLASTLRAANAYNSLGYHYGEMGDYAVAEEYFLKGLAIYRDSLPPNDSLTLSAMSSLATTGAYLGRYTEAEALLRETLNARRSTYGELNPEYTTSLNNLAMVYDNLKDYPRAEATMREVLILQKKISGTQNVRYGQHLNNLALTISRQGRHADAEQIYRQAINIFHELGQENGSECALAIGNCAGEIDEQGRYAEAEAEYRKSIVLFEKTVGPAHPMTVRMKSHMAYNLLHQQKTNEALDLYHQVMLSTYQHYHKNRTGMTEAQRMQLFQDGLGRYYGAILNHAAVNPVFEVFSVVWDWHLNLKGIQLVTTAALRSSIYSANNSKLIQLFESWRESRERLAKLYGFTPEQLQQRGIDLAALEKQATALERELSLQSEGFRLAADTTRVHWQMLQRRLKAGEALVDIARYDPQSGFGTSRSTTGKAGYLIWLLRPEWPAPRCIVIRDASWLESTGLHRYRRGVKLATPDTSVFNRFWAPVAEALGPVRRLYFSPDGVYNNININTLAYPGGGYLLDSLEVRQVGSLAQWVKGRRTTVGHRHAVVVGRPAYLLDSISFRSQFPSSTSPTLRSLASQLISGPVADLPGTEQEARAIASLLSQSGWATQLSLGPQATEAYIKSVSSPSVLHIATHGFFIPVTEGVQVSHEGQAPAALLGKDPLLQSGLLLAGVQNAAQAQEESPEDGILTAYELTALNLSTTQLVVLSACETGLGKLQAGEGIYGLQRSLQVAGASNVVTSLWTVDDNATQQLMTTLYQNWLNGMSLPIAFAQAQRSIRSHFSAPYYWGAFVLTEN